MDNEYKSMTNICYACGFPVANAAKSSAHYCTLVTWRYGEKSDCQKHRDREKQAIMRLNNKKIKEANENEIKEIIKFRECLGKGCADEKLSNRMFESKSVHNRICDNCKGINQGLYVRNVSRDRVQGQHLNKKRYAESI